MATLGSKLITREMQWGANMTELNHLGAALIARPDKILGVYDQIFTSKNYYSDNPLSSILMGKKPSEQEVNGIEWEWDLKGANTRPLIVLENVEPASNTTPGKFGRPFKIKLDQNWYLAGDYIHPGNAKFQVRIQSSPVEHGNGWVYTVVMASGKPTDFLPLSYLQYGQQWGKLYSKYEEAAEQSGSTQFSMPIGLRNRMSLYRKEYKITNFAATQALAVAIPGSDGKMYNFWMKYAEAEYWRQWYRELERGYWYSRSNEKTVTGANGRPVVSGPGIHEQLEDSNIHHYSHLSVRLIEEYLMEIFYGRVKPGQSRKVVGFTGEYGMMQFHRAVSDWMSKSGFIRNFETFSKPASSPYHSNALEAGYQFVRYNMANGASLELVHNPLYDDREINFEIDPITGYPKESQRITFLSLDGDSSSESNIKVMNKKDGSAFTYIEGLYGPYGPKQGGSSAHSGSYYEMHVERATGIHIHDVTKCGELIFERA